MIRPTIGHNFQVLTRDFTTEITREFLVVTYGHNEGIKMTVYGYARVSTDGQTLDAQLDQLKQAGCSKVFSEKESGARWDRPQLTKAISALDKDDLLIVTKLDRLARSTKDLLTVLDTITSKGASFKSLSDQWADTTTPHGKLLVTVLAGFAEFERSLILARTDEGRKRAMAKGIKFGPKFKLNPAQLEEAKKHRASGKSLEEIGALFGVNYRTMGRALAKTQPSNPL